MKNTAKGFIVPILMVIIGLLIIGGGVYIYLNKKSPVAIYNPLVTTPTDTATTSTTISPTKVAVAGMQQYTDANFGFSFWYPSSWNKQELVVNSTSTTFTGGTILKTITVSPASHDDGLVIEEFVSTDKEITDHSGCGPADGCPSSVRYYFDSATHTWMKQSFFQYGDYSSPTTITAANVSTNTMGGLHILQGNARFLDDVLVPLSARNFLIVRNVSAGTNNVQLLAKTITATDPTIATALSVDEQNKIIKQEGLLYGVLGRRVGDWYVDNDSVYNSLGVIIPEANASTFKTITRFSDGYSSDSTGFATDGVHVYSGWSYSKPVVEGADPTTFIPIRQQYQIPYAPSSGKYGESFTSYDTNFSKDASHVWYQGTLIPGADPATFVVTGNTYAKNSSGGYTLAHDAHHSYGTDAKDKMTIDGVTTQ